MIAHAGVFVKKYKEAKAFYTKVLKTVGYKFSMEFDEASGFVEGGNTSFWMVAQKKMTPGHIAFEAKNKKEVESFYRVAIKNGAKDNGKPGYRPDYWPGYYAAFILDADGNNIEAVWFDYSKVKTSKPKKK